MTHDNLKIWDYKDSLRKGNPMSKCQHYQSWMHHGVNINECLEYYQGKCHDTLSPRNGKPCPFNGYPCPADTGEGRWKPPDYKCPKCGTFPAVASVWPEYPCANCANEGRFIDSNVVVNDPPEAQLVEATAGKDKEGAPPLGGNG